MKSNHWFWIFKFDKKFKNDHLTRLDIPGSYGDQVSVIGRCRNGDAPSAPDPFAIWELGFTKTWPIWELRIGFYWNAFKPGIGVAQLVGHVLEVVRVQAVVIPQHLSVRLFWEPPLPPSLPPSHHHQHHRKNTGADYLVIGRPGGSLDALVTAEEEIILGGVGDVGVHSRPCRHVASSTGLVALVRAEEPGVVPLLHCNQGDPGHVVRLQLQKMRWRRILWRRQAPWHRPHV